MSGGARIDYRTYHAINQFVHHHDWLGRTLSSVEMWFVPLFAIAAWRSGSSIVR